MRRVHRTDPRDEQLRRLDLEAAILGRYLALTGDEATTGLMFRLERLLVRIRRERAK